MANGHGGKRVGAGRKPGFAALEAEKMRVLLIEQLRKSWVPIVEKAIAQASDGNQAARDWLSNYAVGKPAQTLELTGKDGENLFVNDEQYKEVIGTTTKRRSGN